MLRRLIRALLVVFAWPALMLLGAEWLFFDGGDDAP